MFVNSDKLSGSDADALLDYFRGRREPSYYFSRVQAEEFKRILTERYPEYYRRLLESADHAMQHKFVLAGNNPGGSYLYCGEEIDWHTSPNGDREGLFTLNRHGWFFDLARASWLTGNSKYIDALVTQWIHWIKACPPPRDGKPHFHDYSPWKTLNAAIRISDTWLPSYHLVIENGALSAEAHSRMIESIHDHGCMLAEHVFDRTHNHTVKEMGALLALSLYFPEFDESDDWKGIASHALEECILNQVLSDGVHFEAVTGYHKTTFEWLVLPYLHARAVGAPLSTEFEQRLRNMCDFAVASSYPDGSTVPFGDSDRESMNRDSADGVFIAGMAGHLFGIRYREFPAGSSPDYLWLFGVDTPEVEGEARIAPREYPDAGYYVMTDLDEVSPETRSYLLIRNGPMRHGHPHADLLSFVLYTRGKVWLTDTGKYTYNEGPERKYLKGTASHNTVRVDWEDQAQYRDRMSFFESPATAVREWNEGEQISFFDGEHYGFHRLPEAVTHRRQILRVAREEWIIVDRLEGTGRHCAELFFQFPVSSGVHLNENSHVCSVTQGSDTLRIVPLETAELSARIDRTWVSPAYGERQESATLVYTRTGRVPLRFVTWISASEYTKPPTTKMVDDDVELLFPDDERRFYVGAHGIHS